MVISHALIHSSPPFLQGVCSLPPSLHRRTITVCIRSKESSSKEKDLTSGSLRNESTNVPSVDAVKLALGIEEKNSSKSVVTKQGSKDSELLGEEEYKNPVIQKLRRVGEWLDDKGDRVEDRLVVFLLLILPIWILAVLLAGGFIQLPFTVPFLGN